MRMYPRLAGGSRGAAICAVAFLLCLTFAPDARADTQVYLIQLADLVNQPNDCGGGSRYSDCTGATKPGFQFTDVLPGGSAVTAVTVEFNHGVQCTTSTHPFEVEFNSVPAGSFMSESWCDCRPRRNIRTVSVPAGAYRTRDVNFVLFSNPVSCQGLLPDSDLGQAYARVTVEYSEDGGGTGGGGEVDLTPVLERLDEIEARLEAAAEATAVHVSGEHASTRAHVSSEHDTTRSLVVERLLAYLVEQDLAADSQGMTAVACLPETYGGHLEETVTIVFETIEAFSAAGCDVSTAEAHFLRGNGELEAGRFVKACDWYRKAYGAAAHSCP